MPVYDISGPIREGIWKYGDAYPDFCLEHTSAEPGTFFFEIFHGMNSQTGVYLETTAHVNGYETGRMLSDVPVSALVNIPCRVLHLDRDALAESGGAITLTILQKAMEGLYFPEGCAILFEAGWDDWYAPEFLDGGPWLTRESMAYLLSKKPSLMGSDTSAWQNEEPVFDL
ncbi:MAG: cyclase family protein, partial [Clostridia bacterium]|nr:cyclase family protein [Clostridia bacterium]